MSWTFTALLLAAALGLLGLSASLLHRLLRGLPTTLPTAPTTHPATPNRGGRA